MRAVVVRSVKWPDHPHYSVELLELGEDRHGVWLHGPVGGSILKAGVEVGPRAEPVLLLVPHDDPWTVAWFPSGAAFVNVGTVPTWDGDRVSMVDLDLDVKVGADGTVTVVDEDELVLHAERYGYPPALVAEAERGAGGALALLRAGAEPFASAWRRWAALASGGVVHPSPSIPQELVDKVVARRGGRLHMHGAPAPASTALVVVDMDEGSCARDPERTGAVVPLVDGLAGALRAAGGVVAWVTSRPDGSVLRKALGSALAASYVAETADGGIGTRPAPGLSVAPGDVHAVKTGSSAFFPGRCDLDEQLRARGIRAVLVAGLVTNVCVESTARDAVELGYEVTLVGDCCVGHSFGLHEAALATFFRSFGDVRPAAEVLGWLR